MVYTADKKYRVGTMDLQSAIEVQYDEDSYWAGQVLFNNPSEVDVVTEDQAFLGLRGNGFTRFTYVPGTKPILAIKETRDGGETWFPGEVWDAEKGKIVRANFVDVADLDAAADFIIDWIREA